MAMRFAVFSFPICSASAKEAGMVNVAIGSAVEETLQFLLSLHRRLVTCHPYQVVGSEKHTGIAMLNGGENSPKFDVSTFHV